MFLKNKLLITGIFNRITNKKEKIKNKKIKS